jgi:hypothetical protein
MQEFKPTKIFNMEVLVLSCRIWKFRAFVPGFLPFLLSFSLQAQQDRNLEFNIVHHGDLKGTVQLSEHSEGNMQYIKVESLVQTRFLFHITVKTIEEVIYREGLLISSRFYQKINEHEQTDRGMIWNHGTYQCSGRQNAVRLPSAPVEHTVLSLYYKEPLNIREVFSDNFQQYLPVSKTSTGQYRVDLPNGNSNYYIYHLGSLVRVEVEQPFYALQFILKP